MKNSKIKELTAEEFTLLQDTNCYYKIINSFYVNDIHYEENHGKRITQSSGYVPLGEQIQQLVDAGKRLEDLKVGTYDWQDDNINFNVDHTRDLKHDEADACENIKSIQSEIRKTKKAMYEMRKNAEEDTKAIKDFEVSMGDIINKSKISPKADAV